MAVLWNGATQWRRYRYLTLPQSLLLLRTSGPSPETRSLTLAPLLSSPPAPVRIGRTRVWHMRAILPIPNARRRSSVRAQRFGQTRPCPAVRLQCRRGCGRARMETEARPEEGSD
jgi:hypothetical protein